MNLLANLRGLPEDRGRSTDRDLRSIDDAVTEAFKKLRLDKPVPEDAIFAHWHELLPIKLARRCARCACSKAASSSCSARTASSSPKSASTSVPCSPKSVPSAVARRSGRSPSSTPEVTAPRAAPSGLRSRFERQEEDLLEIVDVGEVFQSILLGPAEEAGIDNVEDDVADIA